ncbi:MAG: Anti-sigma factor RskA [Chloroflexi bacterium]|nr:Anti-sigma factor RskA [Chloroflexota bacterium]
MTHDEVGELLGAYALEVVSAEERAVIDEHIKDCPVCAAEVADLMSVHDQLALASVERDPPPALRTRLMNLVELDRNQWLLEQARSAPDQGRPTSNAAWWKRIPMLAYGAGAAVLVAAVVLAVVFANRNSVTVHLFHGSAVAQVVKGIDLQGAAGTVGVRSDHSTDVTFSNLPALPSKLAYELWLIPAKGNPVAVGGFNAGANRSFTMRYNKDATGFAAAAVTIERAPGNWPSPSPNSMAIVVKLAS